MRVGVGGLGRGCRLGLGFWHMKEGWVRDGRTMDVGHNVSFQMGKIG